MAVASSLLQAIKRCRQACPPGMLMRFSQQSIPESLVGKKKIMSNSYCYSTALRFGLFFNSIVGKVTLSFLLDFVQ